MHFLKRLKKKKDHMKRLNVMVHSDMLVLCPQKTRVRVQEQNHVQLESVQYLGLIVYFSFMHHWLYDKL